MKYAYLSVSYVCRKIKDIFAILRSNYHHTCLVILMYANDISEEYLEIFRYYYFKYFVLKKRKIYV